MAAVQTPQPLPQAVQLTPSLNQPLAEERVAVQVAALVLTPSLVQVKTLVPQALQYLLTPPLSESISTESEVQVAHLEPEVVAIEEISTAAVQVLHFHSLLTLLVLQTAQAPAATIYVSAQTVQTVKAPAAQSVQFVIGVVPVAAQREQV